MSLCSKSKLLMQAAMGYINIEQNKIMKFFSSGIGYVPTGNACGIHLWNEL